MINSVAFSLGLLGSLHCMIMCGPLIIGVSQLSADSSTSKVAYSLIYNGGRITAYVLLGLVFGAFGQLFSLLGLQQVLSIIAGFILITLCIMSLDIEQVIFRYQIASIYKTRYTRFVSNTLSRIGNTHPIYLGFLNGLLPCGMVYVALAGAINSADIIHGATFMCWFGIGTLPMLMGLMLASNSSKIFKILRLNRVVIYGQLILGIYLIWRGIMVRPDVIL